MPIDAFASHCFTVLPLVMITCTTEQLHALTFLYNPQRRLVSEQGGHADGLTFIAGFSIDCTHWRDSMEHERTVSVRPSRNKRVIDASYVKLNRPES